MNLRYQITLLGTGFSHRHKLVLGDALTRLSLHLLRVKGPYTIGDQTKEYTRPDLRVELRRRFTAHPNVEQKLVVKGSRYDDPTWAIRSTEVTPKMSPLITYGAQFVGRSSYELGADGPPGPSDCSSFTDKVANVVAGVDLVHSADAQLADSRIEHFHDPGELQSGDFVFLNYGRKPWPDADHVEFWVRPGQTLGSRPSTNGVNYYRFSSYDEGRVITYGRLRA